ncbi:hypothetical protein RAB80_004800 [Fusarium oxysporum f. sp. vasinfectum]|nr:hypothetical protein RAB80_004800 [Fusarium oxysporum f. sp. vasinfectum]
MDRAACHVIYVNRNASEDGLIHSTSGDSTSDWAADEARHVVQPLLDAFGDVHVCASGGACLTKLFELQEGSMLDLKPTLVLLDTPNDGPVPEARRRASSPSPSCSSSNENVDIHTPDEALYGLGLLQKIITEAHLRDKVENGRGWGVNEEKPFAYLREAMVSGLMKGICRLGTSDDQINNAHVAVSSERQSAIAEAIGSWRFCAHSFTDDELLVAAMDMFRHALAMPELERWRIHADQLISFLVACRAAYNSFVPYHNFRHVVDVLQATFNFLVHIGALSPYPSGTESRSMPEKSPMASLITPFEALTLLITAIGHDVGHPGVNNGFLVTLNAPLAQLYNDRSVLESFHCAAYSQILRRYWPSAFEDTKMRNLMISSILATDMGLHFDYMKKLGDVQERLQANNSADGWNGRQIEENKSLACSLLIKCADISNVARNHEIALKWTYILSEEFSRQASMESELSIPSSLMTPPKQDMTSLAKGQLGFMNLFATPLFQGVADIMPAMQYTVDELEMNKSLFELKLQQEKEKQPLDDPIRRRLLKEGTFSPRTMSFAVPQEEEKEEKRDMTTLFEALDRGSDTTPVGNGELPMPRPERDDLSPADSQRTMGPSAANGVAGDHRGSNGSASTFDAVRELANSDPFQTQTRRDSAKQRSSETTDGSVSGACSGDWASQATSATTGKMPMSPSTRGTSIVSGDSTEHAVGIPKINVDSASLKDSSGTLRQDGSPIDDETRSDASTTGGSIGRAEGKSLRKKTSRFRIKDLPFFRRHKGTNSPSTADMTG